MSIETCIRAIFVQYTGYIPVVSVGTIIPHTVAVRANILILLFSLDLITGRHETKLNGHRSTQETRPPDPHRQRPLQSREIKL